MLQSENKDHLSPVDAGAGTELGNKDIKFFHEVHVFAEAIFQMLRLYASFR